MYAKDFFRAMETGNVNIDELKRLDGYPNSPMFDYNGTQIIHIAAKYGNTNLVKNLLDDDADVNMADRHGWTPLHYAVSSVPTKINIYERRDTSNTVRLLLERGANTDAKTAHGKCTPVHFAAGMHHCNKATADALLEYGANMETPDAQGETPEEMAVRFGNRAFLDRE